MSRLKRFQHLEAPREGRPGEASSTTDERFANLEAERPAQPATPASTASRGGAAERFQRQVSEQPLALDARVTGEQQFIRCMRCEADNSRYARECIHCGTRLDTDEQR